jgi:hypothetical protein
MSLKPILQPRALQPFCLVLGGAGAPSGRRTAAKFLITTLGILFSVSAAAAAAPCRNYPASAAHVIKPRIEAIRLLEREAADRLIGLDTRPWSYLVGQARTTAVAIGEARALQDEDGLERCPDPVPHVRRVCAIAALALAAALEEQAAGATVGISKQSYAQAMAICEGFMGLAPLHTFLRASD